MNKEIDKIEGICQDCIHLNKIMPIIEQMKKENEELNNILTEFEKWLEEEIKKLKQSKQEIINLNISNTSKAINIREFNIRITTNSICLDKLQELKGNNYEKNDD